MGLLDPQCSVEMVYETCCSCHIVFAMPASLNQKLRDHPGTSFWCPAGHDQYYTGKSDAQKLREQLEQKEKQLSQQTIRLETLRHERDHQERCATRLRKKLERVKKGVCPCCNRTFQNLWEHMMCKHPEYKP